MNETLLSIAAILTPIAVIIGYFRTKSRSKETQDRVAEVHILVNSKMQEALDRIDVLEKQLVISRAKEEPGV